MQEIQELLCIYIYTQTYCSILAINDYYSEKEC